MAARLTTEATDAVPIWFVSPENWDEVRGAIGETSARFAAACGFEPKPGRLQLLPDASGGLAGALFGQAGANAGDRDPLAPGKLATALPAGDWRFANSPQDAELATLGFLLG
ncbi:MAG: leucyl aminopeptidase family protein, partial [Roseiarcus sp.]